METYTVSIVMDNVDLTDEVLDTLFVKIDDVVPSSIHGVVKITAPIVASDDGAAAFKLIEEVRAALPAATAVRLDQDLVAIPDIAERCARSRESVRLLVDGKRGPGRFPPPVGTVGDAIRVWPWAVVLDWFRDVLSQDLGEHGVSPETAAFVDACLAGLSLVPASRTDVEQPPSLPLGSVSEGSRRPMTTTPTACQNYIRRRP